MATVTAGTIVRLKTKVYFGVREKVCTWMPGLILIVREHRSRGKYICQIVDDLTAGLVTLQRKDFEFVCSLKDYLRSRSY